MSAENTSPTELLIETLVIKAENSMSLAFVLLNTPGAPSVKRNFKVTAVETVLSVFTAAVNIPFRFEVPPAADV